MSQIKEKTFREKLTEAIIARAGDTRNCDLSVIEQSLRYLSDTSLLAFAIELEIDTDKVLS